MATINDIAEKTGYSTATVSRVVNNSGYASLKTKQIILSACRELGYPVSVNEDPNSNFSRTNSDIIAMIIPDIAVSFYSMMAKHITKLAGEKGKSVIVLSADESPDNELKLLDTVKELKTGGLIICPVLIKDRYNREMISKIKNAGTSVVFFDRVPSDNKLDTVCYDDASSTKCATEALIQAGHKKIALVLGSPNVENYIDRYRGYVYALADHNMEVNNNLVMNGGVKGENMTAISRDNTLEMIQKHPDLTGIVCTNNMMALGCMRAIEQSGKKIGKDISIVSFDYGFLHDTFPDEISTIMRPIEMMGDAIFNLLLERMSSATAKGRKRSVQNILIQASNEPNPPLHTLIV